MNEFGTLLLDDIGEKRLHCYTSAQKALAEQKTLPPSGLVAGAYYRGYFADAPTIGRWNGQNYRFVVWQHDKGQPALRAARHVAESGRGEPFAPLEKVEVNQEYHISDFALATTR